jgi:hypothetical protein
MGYLGFLGPNPMKCFRCGSGDLPLASLWPAERSNYVEAGIVMRQCMNCGLEQNHCGHDEVLLPEDAAHSAPRREHA